MSEEKAGQQARTGRFLGSLKDALVAASREDTHPAAPPSVSPPGKVVAASPEQPQEPAADTPAETADSPQAEADAAQPRCRARAARAHAARAREHAAALAAVTARGWLGDYRSGRGHSVTETDACACD